MFGLVASGRLINTSPQQVDVNKFVFPLVDPHLINHVVVLLLGTVPLEPGYGVAVYLYWLNPDPCWQYLGFITNEKPSAIFKLNYAKKVSDSGQNPFGFMAAQPLAQAQIGLSIEPLSIIAQQVPPSDAVSQQPNDFVFFTHKMLENFHNFAASYAMSYQQYIPYSVLQKWHDKFLQKLSQDPNFWKE